MKKTGIALIALGTLITASSAYAITPIKGSLNYVAPAQVVHSVKAGEIVFNQFSDGINEIRETYVRQDNGSLKLLVRHINDSK